MSFSDILNKLAEKKAIQGNSDFAYRLISVAEKMKEEKEEEETKAEMIKRGKDKKASTLEQMIHKYAGKKGKGSFKNKIKEMDGFLRMDGKAFCFQNNAQAKKALGVAEQAANFLNWQVMKGDGCFKLVEMGRDKKASTLEKMIHKYAGKNYKKASNDLFQEAYDDVMHALMDEAAELGGNLSIEQAMNKIDSSPGLLKRIQSKYRDKVADLIYKSKGEMKDKNARDLDEPGVGKQNEPDDQELFDFLKKNPGYFDDLMKPIKKYEEPDDQELFERLRKNPNLFKESSLKDLIKKYAKEDWEISSEEAYEPFVNTDVDPLQFDDIYDAMGKGFEDGKRDPETNKNPYDPVKHDDSLIKAYNDGFETAASDFMGRGSY